MAKFILGKKIGMTRIYNEAGKAIPVTVIEAGPIFVTQINNTKDGASVQIGYGHDKHIKKPQKGHLAKNGIELPLRQFKEYKETIEATANLKVGDEIDLSVFEVGDIIDVSGVSKGKGFAGTVKRHHFHCGPKTHGSHNYRRPGSIGSAYPQRVFKGVKMAGHLGSDNVTVKKLQVVEIHPTEKLLVVAGSVPGSRGTILTIKGA